MHLLKRTTHDSKWSEILLKMKNFEPDIFSGKWMSHSEWNNYYLHCSLQNSTKLLTILQMTYNFSKPFFWIISKYNFLTISLIINEASYSGATFCVSLLFFTKCLNEEKKNWRSLHLLWMVIIHWYFSMFYQSSKISAMILRCFNSHVTQLAELYSPSLHSTWRI